MALTAAAVVAEWGAYYRAGSRGVQDLMVKLMQKSETEALFPVRPTNSTQLEKAVVEFQRVLQRFQKTYTPIGDTIFTPSKIPLYKLKIDKMEAPDDLEETWLGFLVDNSLTRKDWPIIKWLLDGYLSKADEDMETHEIYYGVPGIITPGVATPAGQSLLGIRKQINDSVTAGKANAISMGAVPTDPKLLVDYVEDMVKQIPELMRKELDVIVMNDTMRSTFKEGMGIKYNTYYQQATDPLRLKNFENITVAGVASHAGSDKIWTTPKWNRQRGIKRPGNERIFEVENVDRQVKAYTDYSKGVGFWIEQYLYSNDQDMAA